MIFVMVFRPFYHVSPRSPSKFWLPTKADLVANPFDETLNRYLKSEAEGRLVWSFSSPVYIITLVFKAIRDRVAPGFLNPASLSVLMVLPPGLALPCARHGHAPKECCSRLPKV